MSNKQLPPYSYAPSAVFPAGRHTGGTSHHIDEDGLGVDLSLIVAKDRVTGKATPIDSSNGSMLVADSGFYADIVNFMYYVRPVDYALYNGPNRLYVDDSIGRHKKIVTFKKGSIGTDLAQVTVLYYQIAAFPTKITSIQTYYDLVSYYIDGLGEPFYDYNSATQQNITQNP